MNDKTENEKKARNMPVSTDGDDKNVVASASNEVGMPSDGRGVPSEQPPVRVFDADEERVMDGGPVAGAR